MARMLNFLTILVAILILLCRSSSGIQIGYDSRSMIFDGERKLIFSGSIHYARSTPEMWPDLIQKSKDGGLDAIETYIFWNAHEPRPRQYKFEGNLDFIKFFKLIQEAGLYAILRIGPYICAEWNYGGLPVWLHNIEGCQLRTDNEIFKNEMQIFTTKIVDMCKEANLFAPQGGPIILAQIENEYGIVESSYGEAGKAYLKWCAQMAVAQNIGVPWIMCKQDDAPQPIDGKFFLPAWSVSILGGCQKELYNTAKVTTQTSIMVKQAENYEEDYPADPLSWMWAFEFMKDTLQGKGRFSARQLFEQTRATSDASDYLWYMTSATNGLKQNEAFIDKIPYGITGPVGLTDNGSINIDLSSNTWKYKVGLNGEAKRFHDPNSPHAPQWKTAVDIEELPTDRSMTWYKTTFRAPSGTDPVVVDLIGMGKGQAWINGNSLGRFWPSRIADSNGCDVECNYRGEYHFGNTATKCVTNCGNPTQRWYHVPRSFLTPENNILILFEEIGGNPLQVSFQTVTVGSICASADEGSTLQLSCQDGKVISEIIFASFGDPKRTCGRSTLQQGSCHATQSQSAVEQRCIGRDSCSIVVSSVTLGSVDCGTATKRLSVQAICETETLFLKKLRMKKAGEKAV
ncbi:hypothetical protein COLO4_16860 [Corchorus olitorius]|uniref:Beta-galactosidase n=1 Tax=Corchorus olitorius TaxID=93759 RepID=A0A1R3JF12_9ROSI|nr:hypothetical protein COLO4_16860 [Corchorus olitorius]